VSRARPTTEASRAAEAAGPGPADGAARRPGPASTRERLLDAALEVIGEHGIAGLTNRRVAARAGLSLGSLTYHFASQTDVLREALETFVDREVERIAALAARLAPLGLTDAAATAEAVLEEVAFAPQSVGVLELYLHAGREPLVQEAAARCWEAYDRLTRAILGALEVVGAERLAPQVVSLIAGTQLRWLASGHRQPGDLADGLAGLLSTAAGADGHLEAVDELAPVASADVAGPARSGRSH